MPRNRTTNRSAFVQLRSEIRNLKQEINPIVKASGKTFNGTTNSSAVQVRRSNTFFTSADTSGAFKMTGTDLTDLVTNSADAVTITKIKIQAPGSTWLTANLPTPSVVGCPFGVPIQRMAATSLARIPTIVFDFPDAHMSPVGTPATTDTAISGSCIIGGKVLITVSYTRYIKC